MLKPPAYPEATQSSYRPDIDGLRAVAVLSVVAFHAFPEFARGGFIGVDIFFVISGYLITSIIVGHLERGDFSFAEFYQRRIRRIFPALILVLIACALFGRTVLFADEYQQLGKHIVAGAGFVSNLLLWSESGYFDNSADTKPLLHLWSLGIEEQFYFVWPLILWAAYRLRLNVIVVIATIGLASFWLNVRGLHDHPVATFYSPLTRLWELLCGAALAWWATRATYRAPQLSLIGAALICACMLFVSRAAFPGWWALMPTVGAALIIASEPQSPLNRVVLSNPVLVWVGLISFPLYLWHWPLLSFARIIEGGKLGLEARAALAVTSIVLAWATFRFIEHPIRINGGAKIKTASLVLASLVAGFIGYLESDTSIQANAKAIDAVDAQFVGPSTPWKYDINDNCRKRFPMPGAVEYAWWFCMLQRNEPPTVILLGNSHSNDFFPGFVQNPEFANDNVLSIGDCGPQWVDKTKLSPETDFSPCSGYRPYDQMVFINDIIATNKSLRLAVLGSLPASFSEAAIDSLRQRISFLESNNLQVVVFATFVALGYDIRSCYPRRHLAASESCEIKAENYEPIKQKFRSLQEAIHRTNPKTLFWDANFFCNDIECSFKLGGIPLLRDQYEHLSEYASVQLIRHFSQWAKLNAPELLNPSATRAALKE